MRGFRGALGAALFVGGLALLSGVVQLPAANISLYTGPGGANPTADFPVGLGTVNQLVQAVNGGTAGLLNAQTASVGTGADTTEDVLQTYTLPANTLSAAGQSLRITCGWTTGATANNKTVKLYFGASVITTPTQAANAQTGRLSLIVMRTAAATQKVFGSGMAGTGSITPVAEYYNAGTDNLAAGVVIKCTGTNGTAAANDIVANAMITEMIK
jgi:hypothetical protein